MEYKHCNRVMRAHLSRLIYGIDLQLTVSPNGLLATSPVNQRQIWWTVLIRAGKGGSLDEARDPYRKLLRHG